MVDIPENQTKHTETHPHTHTDNYIFNMFVEGKIDIFKDLFEIRRNLAYNSKNINVQF